MMAACQETWAIWAAAREVILIPEMAAAQEEMAVAPVVTETAAATAVVRLRICKAVKQWTE